MNEPLVIKRSEWYRGNRTGSALLRKQDGRKCCLGFECLLRGIPANRIEGRGLPIYIWDSDDLRDKLIGLIEQGSLELYSERSSCFIEVAATLNDYSLDSDKPPFSLRDKDFTSWFRKHAPPEVWDFHLPTSEADREAIIQRLFKHFLDREVIYED